MSGDQIREHGAFDERSPLDEIVRRGAQEMLQAAIDAEVEQFIYYDLEGNLTRFQISGYESLAQGTVFAPPAEIEWLEE